MHQDAGEHTKQLVSFGVFDRFDVATLLRLPHLVCLFACSAREARALVRVLGRFVLIQSIAGKMQSHRRIMSRHCRFS